MAAKIDEKVDEIKATIKAANVECMEKQIECEMNAVKAKEKQLNETLDCLSRNIGSKNMEVAKVKKQISETEKMVEIEDNLSQQMLKMRAEVCEKNCFLESKLKIKQCKLFDDQHYVEQLSRKREEIESNLAKDYFEAKIKDIQRQRNDLVEIKASLLTIEQQMQEISSVYDRQLEKESSLDLTLDQMVKAKQLLKAERDQLLKQLNE